MSTPSFEHATNPELQAKVQAIGSLMEAGEFLSTHSGLDFSVASVLINKGFAPMVGTHLDSFKNPDAVAQAVAEAAEGHEG